MRGSSERPSAVSLIGQAFYAGPAGAVLTATRVWSLGPRRFGARLIAGLVTVIAALVLLFQPMRWQVAVAAWAALCAVGALVAVVLARRGPSPKTEEVHESWGRRLVVTAVPLAVAVISLMVVARLLGWTLLAGWLARFNPKAIDPSAIGGELVVDSLWAVPVAWVFAAQAFRRRRLDTGNAVLRAVLAWTTFLVLLELIVLATFGVMRSQLITVVDFDDGQVQMVWVKLLLGAGAVAFTTRLAWGAGPWWRRGLATVASMLLVVLSLGTLTGGVGNAQLALGRWFDRQGEVEPALRWYGRALVAGGGAPLRSYLQYRIGWLQYQRGNFEQAAAAFRLVATTHNANEDLVRESTYFLDRLGDMSGAGSRAVGGADSDEAGSETRDGGKRVVLDGIAVSTERRADYCAPNTMALVFHHWGRRLGVGEIGEQIAYSGSGTEMSAMRFLFERHDLSLLQVPLATLDDVRWLIDHGFPALLFTPGHVLAVYGYDDQLGSAVTYDTATWGVWVDRPYPDLLRSWSDELFLLGVVLPRDDTSPAVAEARRRFDGARAAGAWQWALYWEAPGGSEEEAGRLRRGVVEDPTSMVNTFTLLELTGRTPWLEQHADLDAVTAKANALLARPFGIKAFTIGGLAQLHFGAGRYEQVIAVAEDLRRRDLHEDGLSAMAGRAAAALERWDDAVFYLTELVSEEVALDAPSLVALAEAYRARGDQDQFLQTLRRLAEESPSRAFTMAESLDVEHDVVILIDIDRRYLARHPHDVERQLRFAERVRSSVRRAEDRPRWLQEARQAVALAKAFARDPIQLERVRALARAIDEDRAAARLDDL